MRKSSGLILVFLAGFYGLFAQAPKSSVLWEISGKGLPQPSYVFGTFHIMCKGDFLVTETLAQKIRSAGQFYGELKMDDPSLQSKLMSQMIMPGKTLHSFMTDDEFTLVSAKFLQLTGMPMSIMDNFKPFMAMSLLALKSTSCNETVQPETEMVNVAAKNNMGIFGLEAVDEQLDALSKEPIDSQVIELKKTVLNFDSVKNAMLQLQEVYKKNDIDALYSFMIHTGISEDFQAELLTKRNYKWIPLMQKAMLEKPTFFAVGSGHLGGPEGVISLLRKQGYTLKPVQF